MLETLQTAWLEPGEKLVCFGDSLTAANPGYMNIISDKLSLSNITVINAGYGGDKTPTALTRLDREVGIHKPDAVSIFLGANDAAVGRGIWADEPVVTPECYLNNLQWIVHILRLRYQVKKISIATPLWRFEGATYDMHGDILAPYRLAARSAADTMRTLLVPLDTVFEAATLRESHRRDPETGYLFTKDGTHPTQEGYKLVAETFLKYWKMA